MGLFEPNIDKMEAVQDVNGLIRMLHHRKPHIRYRAAEARGEMHHTLAVVPLLLALHQSPDYSERECYLAALGKIGDKKAVRPLLAWLGRINDQELAHWKDIIIQHYFAF